jgi:hypothetical protein
VSLSFQNIWHYVFLPAVRHICNCNHPKNPQENIVCERMRQNANNILGTLSYTKNILHLTQTVAVYGWCTMDSCSEEKNRRFAYQEYLLSLRHVHGFLIDYNLHQDNLKQRNLDYEVGMKVPELTQRSSNQVVTINLWTIYD